VVGFITESEDEKAALKLLAEEPQSDAVLVPDVILASPAAKRLARERGIDLREVTGSGPDGRITQEDVETVITQKQAAPAAVSTSQEKRFPLKGVRKIIFQRMAESLHSSAQVTLQREVDVTTLVDYRERAKEQAAKLGQAAPGYNAILIHLTARALVACPYMNASLEREEVVWHNLIHIGLAVDTLEGLVVVVVRDADQKSILEIHKEIDRMVAQAQNHQAQPENQSGSTFTLTNLGGLGVDGFTPILNSPEVGILGIGRIQEKPVIQQGKIGQRAMCTLSLTFDHRIVDGVPAAKFLQKLTELIEAFE
jgi:pyruvate dehydrogenase E2 component (dihydrolipoamide acetyltransferase)